MATEIVKKKKWGNVAYEFVSRGRNRGEVRVHTSKGPVVIPRFPHIKRVYTLEGIFKHLGNKVWVEEKVDGYNVRIAQIEGEIYAFTRGGVLCPFSTEKIRENAHLVEFLSDNPDIIVNGEMAGPDNPYITQWPKYVTKDVKLFVFDMMRKTERRYSFIPVKERAELVDNYDLPHVRYFGWQDRNGLRDVVLQNFREIEGIVAKSESRKMAVKYVFPDSDIDDISVGATIFPEINSGYFLQRLVRSSIFLDEHSINKDEYYLKIGKAFVDNLVTVIEQIKKGELIHEDFTILVKNPKTAYDLIELLSEHVKTEVIDIEKHGQTYQVKIRKYYSDATTYWRERLHGKAFID